MSMRQMSYSSEIAGVINDFLVSGEWDFSFHDEIGIFQLGLNLESMLKSIRYIIDVKENAFIVYGVSPVGADQDDNAAMAAMAEFVCRANYGLINGGFELDMNDGEIRYKCFVDCDGILPTREMVRNAIYCVAAMFEKYGNGITKVIFAGISAKDAVRECEATAD